MLDKCLYVDENLAVGEYQTKEIAGEALAIYVCNFPVFTILALWM